MQVHSITPDVTLLSDCAEVPGLGFLPVNTFVLHAEQPLVVDTGLSNPDKDFVRDLSSVVDPSDVRWIWLTHPDRDHTGGLFQLLEAAPHARLITTFIGAGIMSTQWEVPLDRVYFLNPGQSLDIGDRTLTGYRPPLFDNPATVGFLESKGGAFFSSDCFGGPMPSADLAQGPDVREAPDLESAMMLWAADVALAGFKARQQGLQRLLVGPDELRAVWRSSDVVEEHVVQALGRRKMRAEYRRGVKTTDGFDRGVELHRVYQACPRAVDRRP